MSNIVKGLVAGLIATLVLSVLMMAKSRMGVMPDLDPVAMMTSMAGASSPLVGWAMHVMIGTVLWGILFALVHERLPGGLVGSGVLLGIGAWVLMMVAVMPMAGAGMFGMNMGMMAPAMTLMLHIIFGAVLGYSYGRLGKDGGGDTSAA